MALPAVMLEDPDREALPGEINGDMIDRFTAAHYAVGFLLGAARVPWWIAIPFSIGWEFVERPLKRAVPSAFPNSTQDTIANAAGDSIAMIAGFSTWALISSRR